jgi:hypothetical protein
LHTAEETQWSAASKPNLIAELASPRATRRLKERNVDLRRRFDAFTLLALRAEARRLGLALTGSRADLVARLASVSSVAAASTPLPLAVAATPPPALRPGSMLRVSQSERKAPRSKRSIGTLSPTEHHDADDGDGDDDGSASTSAKRRLSVGFKMVEIREYERQHAGSGGVPYVGAYPLGLGWKVAGERRDSLSNFEEQRSSQRHRSDDLPRLDESERRQLLEQHDRRPRLQRAASYVAQRKELDQLRKARRDIGCQCHVPLPDGSRSHGAAKEMCCRTDACPCFANGLECWGEACACGNTQEDCANPHTDKGHCSDVPPPPPELSVN